MEVKIEEMPKLEKQYRVEFYATESELKRLSRSLSRNELVREIEKILDAE